MVMMFVRALAGMVDDRSWFPDLRTGCFLDPDRKGGFYMSAATMHIRGQSLAAELRERLPDPDANERTIVRDMYRECGLDAVELTGGYVDARRGAAVADAVAAGVARQLDWFHISLRGVRSGHSIAVWRTPSNAYVLFDPSSGPAQFLTFERFSTIMVELPSPAVGDEGIPQFAEYGRICCWGLEMHIDAAALPPPPPPPRPPGRTDSKAH
jgi:hypothetical protein